MAAQLRLTVAHGVKWKEEKKSWGEAEALDALRRTYGFDSFRGRQLEAIMAALAGQDCFVLMPTGGGKSLCYALVPAIRPGTVLVVSPLIALMQDQVQALRARGLRADLLSSTRTEADRRRLLEDLQQHRPDTQLLYVTPELLATAGFMRCLRGAYAAGALQLVAVDEAHSISAMGHDFRPAYRQLGAVRRELPRLPLMALTATASDRVQRDIVRQLGMREPRLLRTSFDRPNIRYEVRYLDLLRDREGQPLASPLPDIIALLRGGGGAGGAPPGNQQPQQQPQQQQGEQQGKVPVPCTVIYCHRREDVDRVAAALRAHGIAAAAYHAGLPGATRSRVLQDWQAGRLAVVAATVAFGMGIDRADVRYVLHHSLPGSLEAYYQEAGRAGRDGAPSRSIVYYSRRDRERHEFVLRRQGEEEGGRQRGQREQGGGGGGGHEAAAPNQLRQFRQVVEYCLSRSCRRAQVLRHFGEEPPRRAAGALAAAACCDACDGAAGVAAALQQLAGAEAQRRQQRAAGGKHGLGCNDGGGGGRGGGGGAGGELEFERSWAPEGLYYDQEGPSRALAESEEEEVIEASEDEGDGGAAAAAMHRARQASRGSPARMLAAMERAEERHERVQAGGEGKRARLMQKLDGGGGGGGGGGSAAGSSSGVTDALLQAASRQLAAALGGNPALAAQLGGGTRPADVAAALQRQLATGRPSKPVFQSKLSNLALQLKKARGTGDVPALAAALAALGPPACSPATAAAAAAAAAADAPPTAVPPAPAALSPSRLQQQVAEAVGLAEAAVPASGGTATAAAAEAAAAALQSLAGAAVTAELLQETGAGRQVQRLRKHAAAAVAAAAGGVVEAWKARLAAAGAAEGAQ